jgi:Bacterial protein of unknown function (DUF899)
VTVTEDWLDSINGITVHVNHRDITMAAVSRARYPKIAAYKERMGWSFPLVFGRGQRLHFDYRVSFTPEQWVRVRWSTTTGRPAGRAPRHRGSLRPAILCCRLLSRAVDLSAALNGFRIASRTVSDVRRSNGHGKTRRA